MLEPESGGAVLVYPMCPLTKELYHPYTFTVMDAQAQGLALSSPRAQVYLGTRVDIANLPDKGNLAYSNFGT